MFGRNRAGSGALAIATSATRLRLAVVMKWIGNASKNSALRRPHPDLDDCLAGAVFVAARRQLLRIGAFELQSHVAGESELHRAIDERRKPVRSARVRGIEMATVRCYDGDCAAVVTVRRGAFEQPTPAPGHLRARGSPSLGID